MAKRVLVINQQISKESLHQIAQIIPDWEIIVGKKSDGVMARFGEAEIILHGGREIEAFLKNNQQLKWLQTWYAGVNGLPLDILQEKGVTVTNAKGVHAYSASETIFALLLGLTRNTHTYVKQQQEKVWDQAGVPGEIHEQTMGIIGAGVIGRETAKIAKAFGMKVLGVRQSGKKEDYMDRMYTPEQFGEVLPQCDVVVVILPLTASTENMFTAQEFSQMKKSALFINIGRGPIVNEMDLITALEQKQIAGAGLDVFATEPLPKTSPLWEMDNVMITPHIGGVTEYYEQRLVEDIFIPNLKQYIAGNRPDINQVDLEKGY